MGGITNRDAKRAKNKVFSSGAGGSSKGPSILDKRGQEMQCPHCDRIFKQVGRLQDHVKKQHSGEAEAGGGDDAGEDTPAESAGAAKPAAAKPAPAAAPAAPRMMDVGSRAGAYDVKSPKLILNEMLQQDKQPKARYKAIPGADGAWRCKVVLPHPKLSDKDALIFLSDSHAAPSEEEALQRGAVAALHRIAGDRALERILPKPYVALWKELGRAAEERQARAQREVEKRTRRQAAQKNALRRVVPSTVIMTEEKRKLVEGIISEVRGEAAQQGGTQSFGVPGSSEAGLGGGGASWMDSAAPAALVEDLALLGFRLEDAEKAVAATRGEGAGGTPLGTALDWLCLNVGEEQLPSDFAPGAAGKPITVLHRHGSGSATGLRSAPSAASLVSASVAEADADPAAAELMQYGYPLAMCQQALMQTQGHLHAAVRWLYSQLSGQECHPSQPDQPEGLALEEWQEERVALEAIYGPEVTFHSPTWTALHLLVLLDGGAATAAAAHSSRAREAFMVDGMQLELHVWMQGPYPQVVPVVAVRSPDVPPLALLTLTRRLFQAGQQLLGQAMVYELAAAAAELLPEALEQPQSLAALLPSLYAAADAARQMQELQLRDDTSESGASSLSGGGSRARKSHQNQQGQRRGRPPPPSAAAVAAESRRLLQHHRDLAGSAGHAAMRATRVRLPAAAQRQEATSAVAACNVVVVSGATGCGKSTQVPQFILESAIEAGQGATCNIICTQPRRISAVGLASRVAAERGERVGEVVGYSVRLDSKQSSCTRLLFCTTGVLLRRLLSDPSMTGTSHVVLDEVHERSMESDLLLLLLRKLLMSGSNPQLRVVLMSATADANLFASYFESALHRPVAQLSIPGFTHPVTDLFLEDAMEATGFAVGKTSKWAKKAAGKEKLGGDKDDGGYSGQTQQSLRNIDESMVNYDLIEALVAHVAATDSRQSGGKGGAILVFAPGADEISRVVRALQGSGRVAAAAPGGIRVLPLHGGLPPSHQTRVFERPPPGVLKVVVSTNVAETSITIDDVTYVIDCGRVKEMRFDPERGIARLLEGWVSRASAQQRRGRAGRVRPGTCYRLFSRKTWTSMAKDTLPEVSRAPLEGLVMDVKGILGDADAAQVLAELITPPAAAAVAQAVASLQAVGALDRASQALTPLGRHLTRMPCDPRIGKMLVFGAMLRCLDPVLTIAAAQGYGRPPFFSPPDRREEAEAARAALIKEVAVSKSDHLAVVVAYNSWRAAVAKGGRSAGADFCSRSFVADQAMEAVHAGRRQYADILAELGFVPFSYPATAASLAYNPAAPGACTAAGAEEFTAVGGVDQFAARARVVKAALCAGLYPRLLRVDHPAAKYQKVQGGAMEIDNAANTVKLFDRERGRVFLHPSSVNFTCGKFESGWLAYSELVQTSKVYVREASMVPVYAVLLFGGQLEVLHEKSLVQVDGWASFRAPARIAVLVRELRAEVEALLLRKVRDPGVNLGSSRVVEAMHHLLSTDGF